MGFFLGNKMKKELRYFQTEAIDAILDSLKRGETPYINAVTGFGKSLVMAEITRRAMLKNKRVLQLVPNHTLCVQNYEQTFTHVDNKNSIGICCAKLSKYQTTRQTVIATQTSFLKRRATSGSFDFLLVDEADLVSPDPSTTYQKIIKSLQRINPKMMIIGLTGSPYRPDQGQLHDQVKEGVRIFSECCYESDIPRLINEGYLSSVKTLNTHVHVDLDGVRLNSSGEYDQNQAGVKFDAIIVDAVKDFKQLFDENDIKTSLIFASTVANGQRIVDEYGNNDECKLAHGNLSKHERDNLIKWLKKGAGKRYLVNVGLYTRGFDFPQLESIVMLRATTSLRLYIQIIGRLLRTHDEKDHGFLCDYGSNVERFGPIDNITPPKLPKKKGDVPKKLCLAIVEETVVFEGLTYRKGDECGYPNLLSAKSCKVCKAEFVSTSEDGKYTMKTKGEILKAKIDAETYTYTVDRVTFEKDYRRKDQEEMIKINFIDEMGLIFHNEYMVLKDMRGKSMLLKMMKKPEDYPLIASAPGGVCVDNILLLFYSAYEKYFKKFEIITLAPATNSKFRESKNWSFKK